MEGGYGTAVTNAYKVAAAFQLTVYELWSVPASGTAPLPYQSDVSSVTELRVKRGWRLRDLAELSRVSTTTLFAIEKGQIPKLEECGQDRCGAGRLCLSDLEASEEPSITLETS